MIKKNFSESLTQIEKDFKCIPSSAISWSDVVLVLLFSTQFLLGKITENHMRFHSFYLITYTYVYTSTYLLTTSKSHELDTFRLWETPSPLSFFFLTTFLFLYLCVFFNAVPSLLKSLVSINSRKLINRTDLINLSKISIVYN